MRPIKFRAWNRSTNSMQYFNLGDTIPYYYNADDVPVNYHVMQSTGLLDRHGKEIWEGDIVRREATRRIRFKGLPNEREIVSEYTPFEVKWGEIWSQDKEGYGYAIVNPERLEIIGNIYSTPELIK